MTDALATFLGAQVVVTKIATTGGAVGGTLVVIWPWWSDENV